MSEQQPGDRPLKFKNKMTPLMVAAHLGRQDVCEWLMGRTWYLRKSLTIADQDKEGKPCTTYDAIMHTDPVERAKTEKSMKDFVYCGIDVT